MGIVAITAGESTTFLLHIWASWSDIQDAVHTEGYANVLGK